MTESYLDVNILYSSWFVGTRDAIGSKLGFKWKRARRGCVPF